MKTLCFTPGQNGNIFLSAVEHNQHISQSGNAIASALSSPKPSGIGLQTGKG